MPIEVPERRQQRAPATNTMSDRPFSQLQPFNEHRFDDCIAYLSAKYRRPLSTYEMMKLHVMIDVHHTLDRGKPVIGGSISAFTNGPVSRSAKSRVTHWRKRYEQIGEMPDGFILIEDEEWFRVKPTRVPEDDDFSAAELAAMEKAWQDVIPLLDEHGFPISQNYFHRDSFIGRAWKTAQSREPLGLERDHRGVWQGQPRRGPFADHGAAPLLTTG